MDKKYLKAIADAWAEVTEKKLSPKQKKHMDTDKDGDIDATDLANLRNENGCGCKEEVEQMDEAGAYSRYTASEIEKRRKEREQRNAGTTQSQRMKNKMYGNMRGGLKKEEVEQVDEAVYKIPSNYAAMMLKKKRAAAKKDSKPPFDGPYKKTSSDGSTKDEYGNTIKMKNRAKHLAKMGMAGMKKEDTDLFSDAELEAMVAMFEAKDKHTAGATKPEGIMDKESPKSKEFASKHKHPGDDSHPHADFDEKGHEDVKKAGAPAVKSQAPTRKGDNKNGDKNVINPVKK
jgi:hypothetical protein